MKYAQFDEHLEAKKEPGDFGITILLMLLGAFAAMKYAQFDEHLEAKKEPGDFGITILLMLLGAFAAMVGIGVAWWLLQ